MGHGDYNIFLPEGESFAPEASRVDKIRELMILEPFHLGKPGSDRVAWEKIKASDAGSKILEAARDFLSDDPLPYLDNELYLYTAESNKRDRINPVIPRFRPRLPALALAECLELKGEFIDQIEKDIRALIDLKAWNFPLHPQAKEFYEGKDDFLDLATSIYAVNLTHALHLLGDRLSPELRKAIPGEVERRIFKPFEKRILSGQDVYWWVTVTHNWNSVCLANILSCALKLKEVLRDRAWYVALTEKLIQYSEDGFEESGFYTEGVGYWNFGFSHYILASELVTHVTRGAIDWLKKPKVERMSHFGARMEIQDNAYPSFADCKRDLVPPQWLRNWLNNRIDPRRKKRYTGKRIDPFDPIHFHWGPVLDLVLFHQVDITEAYAIEYEDKRREWFEDVQFLICRPGPDSATRMAATFKGGHNGVNHSHNDLGTFTVLVGRGELLTDPGKEIYSARTFSKDRYQSDLLNSFGHPVPVVAGHLQRPGKSEHKVGYGSEFYATVVETDFREDYDKVTLDLKNAYRVESLEKLYRTFEYFRNTREKILVTDEVVYSQPESFETTLITYANWELRKDGSLVVSGDNQALLVRISTESGAFEFSHQIIRESFTPARLSWKFAQPVTKATVQFEVTPVPATT